MNMFIWSVWGLDLLLFMIMIVPSFNYKFHPLFLSGMLMVYSMLVSLKINYMNNSYWYSYIFFMLMVGGVMILILYLTSISNNELFLMEFDYYYNYFMKFLVVLFIFVWAYKTYLNGVVVKSLDLMSASNLLSLYEDKFGLFMNYKISVYIISYLFYLMLVAVMICTKDKAPLRQLTKYENIL